MNSIISILIIVTSFSRIENGDATGVWLEEFAVPYTAFEEQGYKITVASIKGGVVPIDPRSIPEAKRQEEWKKAINILQNSVAISSVDASKYDAVFIPGGHGTMFDFPHSKELKKLLDTFVAQEKLIASMCHGPASLLNVVLPNGESFIKGKRVTSFTNNEEAQAPYKESVPFLLETQLRNNGAVFIVKENWADHIEIDGNLITGQNPSSSQSIARAIIERLNQTR
jgi:putative intracellular protease/amidase